jgi:hypothetical protein
VVSKDLPLFWRVTKKAFESVSIHLPNEQNNARLRNPVVRTDGWPLSSYSIFNEYPSRDRYLESRGADVLGLGRSSSFWVIIYGLSKDIRKNMNFRKMECPTVR